jgi:hypothetical protein
MTDLFSGVWIWAKSAYAKKTLQTLVDMHAIVERYSKASITSRSKAFLQIAELGMTILSTTDVYRICADNKLAFDKTALLVMMARVGLDEQVINRSIRYWKCTGFSKEASNMDKERMLSLLHELQTSE